DERVEARPLAGLTEGASRFRLDQVALVLQRDGREGLRSVLRAEVSEGLHDRASNFGMLGPQVTLQDLKRSAEARLPERLRGLGAYAPELGLVSERLAEGIDGSRVAPLSECRSSEPAATRGRGLGELTPEHVGRRVEPDVGEHPELGIDHDEA